MTLGEFRLFSCEIVSPVVLTVAFIILAFTRCGGIRAKLSSPIIYEKEKNVSYLKLHTTCLYRKDYDVDWMNGSEKVKSALERYGLRRLCMLNLVISTTWRHVLETNSF